MCSKCTHEGACSRYESGLQLLSIIVGITATLRVITITTKVVLSWLLFLLQPGSINLDIHINMTMYINNMNVNSDINLSIIVLL